MTTKEHCPDCGKEPIRISTGGIHVTSCLGHRIKPSAGRNATQADAYWDHAVQEYRRNGGTFFPQVHKQKIVDQRPAKRRPEIPFDHDSEIAIVKALAELTLLSERVKEIKRDLAARMVGLRVRHDGRNCYIRSVYIDIDCWSDDRPLSVALWASRKDDPKLQYYGDEYRRSFDFDKLTIVPDEENND